MTPRWPKRALALAAIAAVALAAWLAWNFDTITSWKREASPLTFFTAMAILPGIGAPLTPLLLIAGATFGTRTALIGSGISIALNLVLCYWLAHSALRPWLTSILKRFGHDGPDLADRQPRSIGFAVAVKLAPGLPTFAKNYWLGIAGVPFPVYFAVSMVVTGLYAAGLIILGDALFEHDLRRLAPIGGAALVVVLGLWWWRRSVTRTRP